MGIGMGRPEHLKFVIRRAETVGTTFDVWWAWRPTC